MMHGVYCVAGTQHLKKDTSVPYNSPSQAGYFTEWGLSDCPHLLTAPFQLSCSHDHKPGFKAVNLGAHTVAWKERGWPKRHKDAEVGAKRSRSKGKDILVIELSEARSAAVAAATLQFAAATGGPVVQLVAEGADKYWETHNPQFAKHLRGDKTIVECAMKNVRGYIEERAEEGKQVIFVTNVRLSQLKAAGLDGPAIRKSAPNVITVIVTPLGPNDSEDVRGELSWLIGGGIAELLSGTGPLSDHPPPPKVALENCIGEKTASLVIFSAMTLADFHRRRTGEGQIVHTSLAHCATWGAALIMPPLCHEFEKLRGLTAEKSLMGLDWLHAQPALYGNYMTSDGACIMFTPASPAKTIACVKAFGLMPRAVPKVLFHTFKGILTGQGAFVSTRQPLAHLRSLRPH
jgi:crotonobetainyl-CoA:carnitine CoA-transferase CaiB-like acyl-CoA transferase